ncbi:hypothetical protein jhhlp_008505 [Lomentospora prolificans]|uniref:Uncharacterized protein n=1 Tax=Lomentospora prolificans TaxID=41688 RepID=A0A2N3MY84_9PEZI|nr:hypothetical protein jhhlp_008505 [Lomentospora prolificans]
MTMAGRRLLPSKILGVSLCTAFTMGSIYAYLIHQRIKDIDSKRIVVRETIPEHFKQSWSVKDVTNPRLHPSRADSRFITLEIPDQYRGVSDEALLARFVRGFFGGLVIAPERLVLQTVRMNLVHFTKIGHVGPEKKLWLAKELPDTQLLPLHTALFGVFQVVDRKLNDEIPEDNGRSSQSYVDFGFGSDQGGFSGVHRFSIVRPKDGGALDDGRRTIQIHQQSTYCNPISTKPLKPDAMYTFHMMYAQLLFREGVSEIVRWLEGER